MIDFPDAARDLPPSARLVYLALATSERALTVEEIVADTAASRASVERALAALADVDLVEADTHPVDDRRKRWTAVDRSQTDATPSASTPESEA